MPGGEKLWIDPRFRQRPRRPAAPSSPGTSRPGSATGAGTGGVSPCPPAGTSGGAVPRRRPNMTPQERALEERMARLRVAVESGQQEAAREAAARETGRRLVKVKPQAKISTRRAPTSPYCPTTLGGPSTPIGGATPRATLTPQRPISRPVTSPATTRSNATLGELNAQLATSAAARGQQTTQRLTDARSSPSAVGGPSLRSCLARGGRTAPKKSVVFSESPQIRYIEPRPGRRRRPLTEEELQDEAAALPSPLVQQAEAPSMPPQQTVVIQPGQINPTETTVITFQPAEIPAPRRIPDPFCDFDEPSMAGGQRRGLVDVDIGFLAEPVVCPQRPAGVPQASAVPRVAEGSHPAFRKITPPTSSPPGIGTCAQLPPVTRICPTTVRSVTAHPTSTDPNVSILDDSFDESELLSDTYFGGTSPEDFHIVRTPQIPPPAPAPCPRPVLPPSPPPVCPQGTRTVSDIYSEIEKNKEEWRARQAEKNREFLKKSQVQRSNDANKVFDRVMTEYYKSTNADFAACYREDWDLPEVQVGDLLGMGQYPPPPPPQEYGPSARELMEAMREPDYGPYANELLSSNVHITCLRPERQGPYSYELMENIDIASTGGYQPGPLGAELLSHVDWLPPRGPEPAENIIGDYPIPQSGSAESCTTLTDLLDWW